jgi:hypothetical protein
LLAVLYIPAVGKVFREIEKFFSYRLYKRLSPIWGRFFFVVLVAHRKGHGSKAAKGTRGGRPPVKCNKNICFRLTLQEYQDLRRAAIAEGCSMADILRQAVQQLKRNMKVRRWGR